MNEQERNDLQSTITHALEEMKAEAGASFDLEKVNLSELQRRTGISRKRLRKIKEDGFVVKPHKLSGITKAKTVLTGFTGIIDNLLSKGVKNSSVIKEQLDDAGYKGGITRVKDYIKAHLDLLPAKRHLVSPQGNRGRRYTTDPGVCYQMDWGFVNVETDVDTSYRASCFAMICHHCGERFTEYFPNAKQENLFIGMIHAFERMGVPKYILTDNMKSVVKERDSEGHPIWNNEYANFMKAVGFETKLCKPRHPFTKGAVERLVRFIKNNFMEGRTFSNVTDLNYEAIRWCDKQNSCYHDGVCCIPHQEHMEYCMEVAVPLEMTDEIRMYLWPLRKISFDGFVSYDGRNFGVPYWYKEKTCRVCRDGYTLHIRSTDLKQLLTEHNVTWSRRASFCENQFSDAQPEEFPTSPVKTTIYQQTPPSNSSDFDSFNFEKEVEW